MRAQQAPTVTATYKNVPVKYAQMFEHGLAKAKAGKYLHLMEADSQVQVGSGRSARFPGNYSNIHLRRDEKIVDADSVLSSKLFTGLKWTGVIGATSLITLMLGYIIASRWFDDRIVNPYGFGGLGGYGI